MLCTALCAFREPFEDGFVEAVYQGQQVEVPEELVERLASAGHIERPVAVPMAEPGAESTDGEAGSAGAPVDAEDSVPSTARRRRS